MSEQLLGYTKFWVELNLLRSLHAKVRTQARSVNVKFLREMPHAAPPNPRFVKTLFFIPRHRKGVARREQTTAYPKNQQPTSLYSCMQKCAKGRSLAFAQVHPIDFKKSARVIATCQEREE